MPGVIHDLECTNELCSHYESNAFVVRGRIPRCPRCKSRRQIAWTTDRVRPASVHSRERSVVWLNEKTGSVAYPPVNDAVMPARYANNGYQRVEMDSLHKLDTFCKSHKLVNERAHYDNSGHADDV